jgi:hypothetical protein
MQQYNPDHSQAPPQYPPGGGYQPFNHGAYGIPTEVPGAGTAQICGIVGLVLFFNLIGIICNIIAIVKGNAAMNEFALNPGRYTEASYRKAKSGKTCGIIGLCMLPAVLLIGVAIFFIVESM